jgi:hypothetical protein
VRLIVEADTFTPRCRSHYSQWRSSVASRFSSSSRHSALRSSAFLQMLGVLPSEGLGATFPVSRLRLSQRRVAAKETPKRRTICALGVPRSTAASTLNLRSFEYAFIAVALHAAHSLRNRCIEEAFSKIKGLLRRLQPAPERR